MPASHRLVECDPPLSPDSCDDSPPVRAGGRFGSTGLVGSGASRVARAAAGVGVGRTYSSLSTALGGDEPAKPGISITVHAPRMAGRLFASSHAPSAREARGSSAGAHGRGFVDSGASELLDTITQLTEYTGRQKAPPAWADDGAIVGIQGGTLAVRKVVDTLAEAGVPLSAVRVLGATRAPRPRARVARAPLRSPRRRCAATRSRCQAWPQG